MAPLTTSKEEVFILGEEGKSEENNISSEEGME